MGPFERFFAAVAGAVAAIAAGSETSTDEAAPNAPPAIIAEIGDGVPDEAPPLPTPRPDPEALAIYGPERPIENDEPPAAMSEDGVAIVDATPAIPAERAAEGLAFRFAVAERPLAFAPAEPIGFAAGPELAILPPPLPEPNPLATGEIDIAALPPVPFAPVARQHDRACLSGLAALPLTAQLLEPVVGAGACGVSTPLDVEAIGTGRFEVDLVPAAIVDCSVVGALTEWLEEDVQPAARANFGEWVTGIRVAASYACRGRNNDPNAQLSEHAFGNAIDISAFRLSDGRWLEVEPHADPNSPEARFQAAIRAEACGPFTTVLGPGVAYHDDHFHLDLARRDDGSWSVYCR